jgi:hypothetical protein
MSGRGRCKLGVVKGTRRSAGLPVELVDRRGVNCNVDPRNFEAVLAGRHLCQLFFSRNRAGKPQNRLTWRHAKAQRQRERGGVGGIEDRRMHEILGAVKGDLKQSRANPTPAIRRLDEEIAGVALVVGVARDRDADDLAVIMRRPSRTTFRSLQREPDGEIVEIAPARNCANVVGMRRGDLGV